MVVVHIRVARQHLAGAGVAVVLVLAELRRRGRAAHRVNDDSRQPLQPLHALPHTAGAFLGRAAGQSGGAVVGAGFRLGGVRRQCAAVRVGQAALHQQLGRLAVGRSVPRQFVKNHQRAPRGVIIHRIVGPGVGVPAPVHAVVHPVEPLDLGIRHGPQLQVLKHRRAAAHDLTAVLMAIGRRVRPLQVLGVGPEPCAQHFPRQIAVGGVVDQLAGALLQRVAVGPVPGHGRRIEAFQRQGPAAAAQDSLLDVAHFLGTVELVKLLKPTKPDSAKRQLETFELARVIQPEEQNLLPGGQVGTLHRTDRTAEIPRAAQLTDGPYDLVVHAVAQCAAHFAQHHGVAVRVAQQLPDQLHRKIA